MSGTGTGHFFMAIGVARFMPFEQYTAQVDALVQTVKLAALAPGTSSILLPGERELLTERTRRANGIRITPELEPQLAEAARLSGVEVPHQSA